MSVKSGFFNSQNNDRLYNADDMSNYYEGLISSGVYYAVGDGLAVAAGTESGTVIVGSGRAMINCRWLRNTADYVLELPTAESLTARIDSVAVKLDLGAREMTLEVVKGGSAAPELPETATVKYLRLADVTVPAGGGAVTVTDCRGGTDCPWVAAVTPSSSIVYFDNVYTTTSDAAEQAVGIAEYEPSIDMLEVRLNGISLNPNEYEVSGSGSAAAVTFTNGMETGNELWFRVVKSLDFQLSQVVDAEEET